MSPDRRRAPVVTGVPELTKIIYDLTIRFTKTSIFTLGRNSVNVCSHSVLC